MSAENTFNMITRNKQAYDKIAEIWLKTRDVNTERVYVDQLISHIPPHAKILDLGCGTGKPTMMYLADLGYTLTGVDISEAQLAYARKNVPNATFILSDIQHFNWQVQYDAIIAWDVIFHLPRAEHHALLQKIFHGLLPGGLLLASLGCLGSAATDPKRDRLQGEEIKPTIMTTYMFGETFYVSNFVPKISKKLLLSIGFELLIFAVDDPAQGKHLAVLAQKPLTNTRNRYK